MQHSYRRWQRKDPERPRARSRDGRCGIHSPLRARRGECDQTSVALLISALVVCRWMDGWDAVQCRTAAFGFAFLQMCAIPFGPTRLFATLSPTKAAGARGSRTAVDPTPPLSIHLLLLIQSS